MNKTEFRDWRKRMGWTQDEAARQLGMSRRHISSYEQGKAPTGAPLLIPRVVELATHALESLADSRIP